MTRPRPVYPPPLAGLRRVVIVSPDVLAIVARAGALSLAHYVAWEACGRDGPAAMTFLYPHQKQPNHARFNRFLRKALATLQEAGRALECRGCKQPATLCATCAASRARARAITDGKPPGIIGKIDAEGA